MSSFDGVQQIFSPIGGVSAMRSIIPNSEQLGARIIAADSVDQELGPVLEVFPLHARNQSVHPGRDVQHTRILYNISRAVKAIDEASADLNCSASPCIAQLAETHGLSRPTLSRRWRGVTTSKAQSIEVHKFLDDNQEQELKNYIERLCESVYLLHRR